MQIFDSATVTADRKSNTADGNLNKYKVALIWRCCMIKQSGPLKDCQLLPVCCIISPIYRKIINTIKIKVRK